jgi:hydrogenase maturation protease
VDPPPQTVVLEREGEPLTLLDDWRDAPEAVVVDAVRTGAGPGEIHIFEAGLEPLPTQVFGGSTHLLGLADAVELGRRLDRLPERLVVVGIEGESFTAGAGLSAPVARAVAAAAELVRGRLLARRMANSVHPPNDIRQS